MPETELKNGYLPLQAVIPNIHSLPEAAGMIPYRSGAYLVRRVRTNPLFHSKGANQHVQHNQAGQRQR